MSIKTKFFLLVSTLLLTMCKNYANESTTYANGLSCQNYTDYRFFEWGDEKYNFYLREEGADCSHTCPNGTVKEYNIPGTTSSLYSSSKEDLEAQFCGVASQATCEQSLATASPTVSPVPSPTPISSPTRAVTATVALTSAPVFTGNVSMCDLGSRLINFRLVQPPPDLTGKTLEVEIAEQESTCYVNPTNPSLMTCMMPIEVTFPAGILVRLDGALVNEFVYSGLGCSILAMPTQTPRPIISYP
jgi:hypothetical protein